jgi:type I restriction enzyme S subunit
MELTRLKYKATEIGLIPDDWEMKTLGEVGDVRMCKRIFNYQTSERGDIPFFKIGTFGKEPDAYISSTLYNEFRRKYSFPKKGTVLISAAGTIGRTIVYDGNDAYFQDSNIVWIDNNNQIISDEYLKHVFPFVKFNTEGGTIQRLYNSILKSGRFPAPPTLTEQEAIATALSDVDKLISSLEKLIAKKKAIKQGAMQQLLTPPQKGGKRLPGFSGEWEEVTLGELTDLITKGTTPTSLGKNFTYSGVNFIKAESIDKTGRIINDKVAYIDIETHELLSRSKIKNNDILFTIAGVLGRVGVIHEENLPANTNQAVAIIRLKKTLNLIVPFFFHLFRSNYILKHIDSVSVQGAQANFSLTDVGNIPLIIPSSSEEQDTIAQILSDMDKEIESLELNKEKYHQIKQGMMQELLTGKTRLV